MGFNFLSPDSSALHHVRAPMKKRGVNHSFHHIQYSEPEKKRKKKRERKIETELEPRGASYV